ncbi:MAG: DUF362 domain-containing protein [Desulfobacteraceae bacterium]|nr:DUF362 domain-containing protein [Desulfobacteraceae bacterium]
MTRVLIRKGIYDQEKMRRVAGEMLDEMGPEKVAYGDKVLIKPNLLMAAEPDKGIVTHPMLTRAVAEYFLDRGARVQVSDSPAVSNFDKIIRIAGYKEILKGLDVKLTQFQESVDVDIGEPFGSIPISRDALEADAVINLAKLKTHAQMYLTLGVKNIFGCIVGLRKPEWHMRSGVDRMIFAQLLVQIYEAVAPAYTIVDAVLALEGQGPGKGGQSRHLGLLIGGENAHAVDKTIATLLGLEPAQVLTCLNALKLSLFDGKVHVDGDLHIINDFKFPELNSLSMGPESLNSFMRKYVIQKPVAESKSCKLCGECWTICPAKAITHNNRTIYFKYDKCIRCYCCIEVCPHAAIRAKEPLLGYIWRRYIKS